MKIAFFLSIVLLSACQNQVNSVSQLVSSACPTPQTVYLSQPSNQEGFFERFDYQVRNIVADADTIRFQTLNHDFVYCRSNGNWSIQTGTLPVELQPPRNYSETLKRIVNPPFKSITLAGETYQYRVVLEPQFALDANNNLTRPEVSPASDRVVLELITPNNPQPQRQTLYTLEQLQQLEVKNGYSGVGTRLGIPEITAAVTHGDRIWWSVAFEQGEGNNGIATIVGYQPQTNEFTTIQPQHFAQQITDLVVTGDTNNPTFWFGTKISGEGNPNIPASGLVAYRANLENPDASTFTAYTVHNSPLVGAIPYKLRLEDNTLWVATGNGVCQLNLQTVDNLNWSCWRFALMAEVPNELPLYRGLQEQTPAVNLSPSDNKTVQVLWWYPQDYEQRNGRYEVRYDRGFDVTVDQGATKEIQRFVPPGKPPIDWAGSQWHWNGQRFVRGWDEVARNEFGGGPRGIAASETQLDRPNNINALRGDLELLDLTANTTTVKYYSGWVDQKLLNPYLAVVPQQKPQSQQPNPLLRAIQQ